MGGTAIPAGATVGDLTGNSPAPTPQPSSGVAQPIPSGATVGSVADDLTPPRSFTDPKVGKVGYYINDDGSTVIAPKDGETYQDTVQRAIAHWKSLAPEQQQKQLGMEGRGDVKKMPGTLAGAAAIGFGGPALLAAPGEVAGLAQWLTTAPLGLQPPIVQALPHIIQFAKTLGGLGIGAGVAHAILKELMSSEK